MRCPQSCLLSTVALLDVGVALENGLARTPPMGFNSYLSGLKGAAGLGRIADFFVSSGLRESGYVYVNTDEGWETKTRDSHGRLTWNEDLWPGGLPSFISSLHAEGLKFGIYGAASGVSCESMPGQLYHELLDAETYAAWGVDFLKSDNCASYALDASVRYGAMRDALLACGRDIVLSVEPFAINPDEEVSAKVANLARVSSDIRGNLDVFLDRADASDRWAPLARPGYWNDPDMIYGGAGLGQNRLYFGLWSIMKAPLLLSGNLPKWNADHLSVVNNSAVIAVNQDALGVQARKLAVDGKPLPWLVGLKSCDSSEPAAHLSRGLAAQGLRSDARIWDRVPVGSTNDSFLLRSNITGRCLVPMEWSGVVQRPNASDFGSNYTVALLPCNSTEVLQHWRFNKGSGTVSSVVSVAIDKALAVSNTTLFGGNHDGDAFPVPDAAFGFSGLVLVDPYDQDSCSGRGCDNYDPSQMWFYSPYDKLLRQGTWTSSIQRKDGGKSLTKKMSTWRHHCLAHVLAIGEAWHYTGASQWPVSGAGTVAGETEVWGGPLDGGRYVMALVNRNASAANITARYRMLELPAIDNKTSFSIQSLWDGRSLGMQQGGFVEEVPGYDMAIFVLTPAKTTAVV